MIKEKIEEIKSELNFYIHLKRGKSSNILSISIPEFLEKFLDTEDKWVNLPNVDNNSKNSSCLYKAKKDSVFDAHYHELHDEQILIINPKGKIRVITKKQDKVYKYPESCFFTKGEEHICYFLEDTDIICVWNPPFDKKWEATLNDPILDNFNKIKDETKKDK